MNIVLAPPTQFYYSGKGDDVVFNLVANNTYTILHFTHDGTRNFAVQVYDADDRRDLLVNTIGRYEGYVLLSKKSTYKLDITADGDWSVRVIPFQHTDSMLFSGTGDMVTSAFIADTTDWQFTHDGNRNFAVYQYSLSNRDLLVNTIGRYDGAKVSSIRKGTASFFVIIADGEWTISPK